MKPIPQKLRNELSADQYYQQCCLTGKKAKDVKIDWHHAWTYGKGQINEKWAIMPIWWKKHNWTGDDDSVHNCLLTRRKVQYLSLLRADLNDLKIRMPKKDWQQEFDFLKKVIF